MVCRNALIISNEIFLNVNFKAFSFLIFNISLIKWIKCFQRVLNFTYICFFMLCFYFSYNRIFRRTCFFFFFLSLFQFFCLYLFKEISNIKFILPWHKFVSEEEFKLFIRTIENGDHSFSPFLIIPKFIPVSMKHIYPHWLQFDKLFPMLLVLLGLFVLEKFINDVTILVILVFNLTFFDLF